MIGFPTVATLTKLGRATVSQVGRSRLSPCRFARRAIVSVRQRRSRAFVDVDWFEDVGPDELAG